MSRTITVVTPENIQISYEVAGISSRFLARLIDLLLQLALIVLLGYVTRLAGGFGALSGIGAGSLVTAVSIVLIYLITFAYGMIFEAAWAGRTPGKRALGLRVIREGGYPITFIASATRNLLWFVDFGIFPIPGNPVALFGLPGLISIFLSPSYKRIGDYAAGTLVIVEAGRTPLGLQPIRLAPAVAAYLPYVRNLERLTPADYRILRRFVSRRHSMELAAQAALGEKLARRLLPKLEISAPISFQIHYADLLEAIERRYAEEEGVL